jgi:hypothetical protein
VGVITILENSSNKGTGSEEGLLPKEVREKKGVMGWSAGEWKIEFLKI